MPRSRSSSPALKGIESTSTHKERLTRVRKNSRSPDYAKIRRRSGRVSNERNKRTTSPYTSRRRSTSRDPTSNLSKRKNSPSSFSQETSAQNKGRAYEQTGNSRLRRNITSASPSPPREGVFGEGDMYKTRNIPSKYDEEMPESSNKGENDKFDRKQLAKIKIVTPNVAYSKDEVDINRRKRLEKGICTLEKVLQYTEDGRISSKGATRFNSQEFETPSIKELKKIQIEIRRTIPRDRISTSPVRRALRENSTVVFSRSPEEGTKPIFDRDEIKHWIPDVPEKRVIAMLPEKSSNRELAPSSLSPPRRRIKHSRPNEMSSGNRSRSRSPHNLSGSNIRDRLGPSSNMTSPTTTSLKLEERDRKRNRDGKQKNVSSTQAVKDSEMQSSQKSDIRSRLGTKEGLDKGYGTKAKDHVDPTLYDEEKVLDREELERLRFANTATSKPWETDPEMVPRGNYFEHDNRDDDYQGASHRGRGRGLRRFDRTARNRGRGGERQMYTRGISSGYRKNFNRREESEKRSFENNRGYSKQGERYGANRNADDRGVEGGYYKIHHLKNIEEEVPFFRLPREMMVNILSHIPYQHLITSVSLVCKKFHQIIAEDHYLLTDLEINISSFSPKFEEQSFKITKVLNSAKNLRYLTIHVNNHLCGMLEAVGKQCKQLRGLKILYSTGNFISLRQKEECSSHLISIAENCKYLKDLRLLINCSFYTKDLIKQMLVLRKNTLKALEIDSFELNSEIFRHVSACHKLEELKLPKFERLKGPCFLILSKKLSSIKILELCVRKLSDEYLAQGLEKCVSLEQLTLHQANRLSKNGINIVANLAALKKLQINIRSRGLIKAGDFKDAFANGRLYNLEYLELTGYIDLGDHELIGIIHKYPNLRSVVLDGCNNVTLTCFRYLSNNYKYLRHLKINGHSVPKSITRLRNLKSIDNKRNSSA